MVMIDVDLDADRLLIHFSMVEALLGLVHDLDVPPSPRCSPSSHCAIGRPCTIGAAGRGATTRSFS
jgi:hypothetical protein